MLPRRVMALMVMGLLTLMCAACGGHSTEGTSSGAQIPDFGGSFAGDVWKGRQVTAIHADWRVPTFRSGSPVGNAATWVGVETTPRVGASFIQVGTIEDLAAPARKGGRPRPVIYAFWSDTQRHFHPTYLAAAAPGDNVSATMQLRNGTWTLTFDDLTTSTETPITTTEEGTATFTQAQWYQEDASQPNGTPAPYPDLTPLTMKSLTVNSMPPSGPTLGAEWMRLPGGYLGPTSMSSDGFVLGSQKLSAAGARYERSSIPVNAAVEAFNSASARWRPSTSQTVITGAIQRLVAALRRDVAALTAGGWPPSVISLTRHLAAYDSAQVTALTEVAGAGLGGLEETLRSSAFVPQTLGNQILAKLGLPAYAH